MKKEYLEKVNGITKFSEVPIVNSNPFIEDMALGVTEKVSYRNLGNEKGAVSVVTEATGEVNQYDGKTAAVYRKTTVDNEKFVKLYTGRLRDIFDLTSCAQKVFSYFMLLIQESTYRDKDKVYFSLKDCMDYCGYKQHPQVYRGLTELIKRGFIAKTKDTNIFWINGSIIFNGNRLVVIDDYRRTQGIKEKDKGLDNSEDF